MSRIDGLIARLAPEGVEYRAIGDLGTLVRGNGMPKADFTPTGVGCIHYGQIYTHYGAWTEGVISFVPPEKAAALAKVDPGDLVITNTSENLDDVCKAVAWLGTGQIVTGGHATVLKHDQNPKYLSYYLQTPGFAAAKKRHATGTKVIDVSAKRLARIHVPVPPPEVQAEIVRILDQFVELEVELEAELEARRLQYAHYREELMGFPPDVPRRAMGEIGVFTRGRRFTRDDVVEKGIPSIHYGEIYTHYGVSARATISQVRADLRPQLRFAAPGDVVIAAVGETVEDVAKAVAWLGGEPVAIHDDTFAFRSELNSKFVSYFMQTRAFHGQKYRHVARGKMKRLSGEGLGSIEIPVPSPDEQVRVVAALNGFDALVNDLASGLPAEIVARRQQYEHYRDRLLTFEEARA